MVLYAFGSNGSGQLGIGHKEDTNSPSKILFSDTTAALAAFGDPETQLSLAFGGNHTLLLNRTTGKLYGTGDNSVHQLGSIPLAPASTSGSGSGSDPRNVKSEFCLAKFTELELPNGAAPVTHIAAGWQYSVAITSDGCVYTTGYGPKGELANGNDKLKTHVRFLKVYQFSSLAVGTNKKHSAAAAAAQVTVKQVSASLAHVAAVLSNGEVWGWGVGRKGQLGRSVSTISTRPVRIEYEFEEGAGKALSVVCGRAFTVILGYTNRDVDSPNSQPQIQLLGSDKSTTDMKTILDSVNNTSDSINESKSNSNNYKSTQENYIKSISAGWSAVHILLESGKLVSAGNNSHGQLGPDDNGESSSELPSLSLHSSGTEHSLGVCKDGRTVVAWGWGEHGNCGPLYSEDGPKGEVYKVHETGDKLRVKQVAGGYASSWILEEPCK